LLTISQSMEVAMLLLLPQLLGRCGVRGTMLVGLATWTAGLTVFALGRPTWLLLAALACNGVCVACLMGARPAFPNPRAGGSVRASTQSLLVFVNGVGLLLGNLLVGWVRGATEPEFAPTYWTAVGLALGLLAFFGLGFPGVAAPASVTCAGTGEK